VSAPEDAAWTQHRRYTPEHEWVKLEGDVAVVGITHFAQDQLGDVVYVELPKVGERVEAMKPFGVVESVKTASDLFAPIGGTIAEVNGQLESEPQLVNDAPYEGGWMIKIQPDDPAEIDNLLSAEQYADQVAGSP